MNHLQLFHSKRKRPLTASKYRNGRSGHQEVLTLFYIIFLLAMLFGGMFSIYLMGRSLIAFEGQD